jgi:hypothetical protein
MVWIGAAGTSGALDAAATPSPSTLDSSSTATTSKWCSDWAPSAIIAIIGFEYKP